MEGWEAGGGGKGGVWSSTVIILLIIHAFRRTLQPETQPLCCCCCCCCCFFNYYYFMLPFVSFASSRGDLSRAWNYRTVRLQKLGSPIQWKSITGKNWNNRFQHFQIESIKCRVQNNEISTCSLTSQWSVMNTRQWRASIFLVQILHVFSPVF